MPRLLLFMFLVLAMETLFAAKPDKALQRCIYLSEKIEHYTALRRKGGSSARMASWRKSRSRYEEEFHTAGCRKFSRQLRRKNR
ncbi:hypothetical protein [Congregibacter litoralis]|uniref:Uncharacterized protein n=1 Tax=Congregibacter litoralis KT71 TaxID=314285 RepID=A4AA39_9GAMM|nr:hypothetical protein [Congregibacter litoralis]EAQ97356.2 hypothetical protein KT71_08249 [Congregibacter litoralis KT71]